MRRARHPAGDSATLLLFAVAKIDFNSVDEYIAAQPKAVQAKLRQLRGAIRKAVPAAEETISYGMPTYKLRGSRLLYFAVWKEHYSIYAATESVVAAFRDELAPFEIEKGTIRFRLSESLPIGLIERIARFRAGEAAAPAKKR